MIRYILNCYKKLQGYLFAKCFVALFLLSNRYKHPLFWTQPLSWIMDVYTRYVPFTVDLVRFPFLEYLCPSTPNISKMSLWLAGCCPCIKVSDNSKSYRDDHGILYIHGGGFVSGDIRAFQGIAEQLSCTLDGEVYIPDYTLVPQATLDTIIKDCTGWLEYLADKKKTLTIVADSAGGYIALAVLQQMKETQKNFSSKLILFSPIVSVHRDNIPYISLNPYLGFYKDPTVPEKWLERMFDMAGKDHKLMFDTSKPPSPIFPKNIYISVSESEYLYTDAVVLAAWACTKNISVVLDAIPYMPHSFPLYYKYLKEGKRCIERIARWHNYKNKNAITT